MISLRKYGEVISLNNTIYLAGPWFCNSQSEREIRIKGKLRHLGFNVISPREFNSTSDVQMTSETRKKIFQNNVNLIADCDIIFSLCDGKQALVIEPDQLGKQQQCIDSGTMLESGIAYNMKQQSTDNLPIIIYYAETLNNAPFNLMLQESADIVITDYNDLDNLPQYIENALQGIRKEYNGITE